jgi:hypothetical protein
MLSVMLKGLEECYTLTQICPGRKSPNGESEKISVSLYIEPATARLLIIDQKWRPVYFASANETRAKAIHIEEVKDFADGMEKMRQLLAVLDDEAQVKYDKEQADIKAKAEENRKNEKKDKNKA